MAGAKSLQFADVSGGRVAFAVAGSGPALVVPWLNHPWLDTPWVDALAADFTVVVAAPCGYGASSRLPEGAYTAGRLRTDLVAVVDAAGIERFSLLGYSLGGAVVAWFATREDRVDAVVAGGFPLLGSYTAVRDGSRRDAETLTDDTFDVGAALAFYEHLGGLDDGALVDEGRAKRFAYWGSNDEVLARFDPSGRLEPGLRRRGVPFRVLDGLDHGGALACFDLVLAWVVDCLHSAP